MHRSVSTLPGGGSAVRLCVVQERSPVGMGERGQWAGINAPQQGTEGEQGAAGLVQGLQREGRARHRRHNSPDSTQVSQCSDNCRAITLDGSCHLNRPVVNKWNLLVLIDGEPQACKPPGALQL